VGKGPSFISPRLGRLPKYGTATKRIPEIIYYLLWGFQNFGVSQGNFPGELLGPILCLCCPSGTFFFSYICIVLSRYFGIILWCTTAVEFRFKVFKFCGIILFFGAEKWGSPLFGISFGKTGG